MKKPIEHTNVNIHNGAPDSGAPFATYFAYGSNLAERRLEERGIKPLRILPARLDHYRLCFNKRSTRYRFAANIARHAGHCVWGAVYQITHDEVEILDRFESVHLGHYVRVPVSVTAGMTTITDAFAYVATPQFEVPDGVPADEYLQYLLEGAREHGFPDEYVQTLMRAGDATHAPNEQSTMPLLGARLRGYPLDS